MMAPTKQEPLEMSEPPTPSSTSSNSTLSNVRCQPDPLNPDSVVCLSKIHTEDRQGVSHFFGRNKKATSSIPNEMFPVLCRTHYQEKQYRWQKNPVAFTVFQCDCILTTLGRMAQKTWVDEVGNVWPYWCGFELQLLKQPDSKANCNICPEWLRKLCDKVAVGQEQHACVGDRNGIRVSFEELVLVVCAIKSWCLDKRVRLPPVEALPITIGMLDELDVETVKSKTRAAIRDVNVAELDLAKVDTNISKENHKALQQALEEAKGACVSAQTNEDIAKADAQSSKATVPIKRQSKKSTREKTRQSEDDPINKVAFADGHLESRTVAGKLKRKSGQELIGTSKRATLRGSV